MTQLRKLGYDTECLTCETPIAADDLAYREHGVGAWHADCDAPRNLSIYQRERDRDALKRKRRPRYHEADDSTDTW